MSLKTGEQKRKSAKPLTPLRAIRLKCLDCSAGSAYEVRRCHITDCSLHPYRFGHNPKRAGIGPKNAKFRNESVAESGFGEGSPKDSVRT